MSSVQYLKQCCEIPHLFSMNNKTCPPYAMKIWKGEGVCSCWRSSVVTLGNSPNLEHRWAWSPRTGNVFLTGSQSENKEKSQKKSNRIHPVCKNLQLHFLIFGLSIFKTKQFFLFILNTVGNGYKSLSDLSRYASWVKRFPVTSYLHITESEEIFFQSWINLLGNWNNRMFPYDLCYGI